MPSLGQGYHPCDSIPCPGVPHTKLAILVPPKSPQPPSLGQTHSVSGPTTNICHQTVLWTLPPDECSDYCGQMDRIKLYCISRDLYKHGQRLNHDQVCVIVTRGGIVAIESLLLCDTHQGTLSSGYCYSSPHTEIHPSFHPIPFIVPLCFIRL